MAAIVLNSDPTHTATADTINKIKSKTVLVQAIPTAAIILEFARIAGDWQSSGVNLQTTCIPVAWMLEEFAAILENLGIVPGQQLSIIGDASPTKKRFPPQV